MVERIHARLEDLERATQRQKELLDMFSNGLMGMALGLCRASGLPVPPPLDELVSQRGTSPPKEEKERPGSAPTAAAAAAPLEAQKQWETRHETLEMMYHHWYGVGTFPDDEGGGGIAGRHQKYGPAWRKHFPRQDHSRMSRIIHAH